MRKSTHISLLQQIESANHAVLQKELIIANLTTEIQKLKASIYKLEDERKLSKKSKDVFHEYLNGADE
jgi:cell division protein FtsB